MWEVETTDTFDEWFHNQKQALKEDVLAAMYILSEYGPQLGRPLVDTIKGSQFTNMKELRIQHAGDPVRAFFAFDPGRKAIILCAGNKTVTVEKRFYKQMIVIADAEFSKYLANQEAKWQR
ncbi:MAG: type II toxin-antitoxin system RelE/ParE family toxin [Leclercia adecarboxylata]|nr:type II toxin-antitoxin system RelE/ParE family toxin [Leclercia adecarboxylata]